MALSFLGIGFAIKLTDKYVLSKKFAIFSNLGGRYIPKSDVCRLCLLVIFANKYGRWY